MACVIVLTCTPLLLHINKFLKKSEKLIVSPITCAPLVVRPSKHSYFYHRDEKMNVCLDNDPTYMDILLYGDTQVVRRNSFFDSSYIYRLEDLEMCFQALRWKEAFTSCLHDLIVNHLSLFLFNDGKEVGKIFLNGIRQICIYNKELHELYPMQVDRPPNYTENNFPFVFREDCKPFQNNKVYVELNGNYAKHDLLPEYIIKLLSMGMIDNVCIQIKELAFSLETKLFQKLHYRIPWKRGPPGYKRAFIIPNRLVGSLGTKQKRKYEQINNF